MSSELLSDVCYLAQVAPSGECLRGRSRVRLIRLLAPFVFGSCLPMLDPVVCNWLYLACVPFPVICVYIM